MKFLDLNVLSYSPRWYDYETGDLIDGEPGPDLVAFLIRPRPRSLGKTFIKDGALVLDGAERLATFQYCLVDWRGVTENGKPAPCSEAIKEKIYNFGSGEIVVFVVSRVAEFYTAMGALEKNS